MAFFWERYVPDPAQRTDWRASPLRAPDLSRLPPAMIVASGIDPLYSEGLAYAARLRDAGVPAEHVAFPGMTHAFFQAPSLLDVSRAAIDRAGAALSNAFANP
jgi:acetyl esterase